MTRFLLSHNRQLDSNSLPALGAEDLAAGLVANVPGDVQMQALSHPHWLVQVEADLLPADLAGVVLLAWRRFRCSAGASESSFQLLALGGRKDDSPGPGALLQQGDWGVDVVETLDVPTFLSSINWDRLKQGRAADGVIELLG